MGCRSLIFVSRSFIQDLHPCLPGEGGCLLLEHEVMEAQGGSVNIWLVVSALTVLKG
jgi:hypothetical protein